MKIPDTLVLLGHPWKVQRIDLSRLHRRGDWTEEGLTIRCHSGLETALQEWQVIGKMLIEIFLDFAGLANAKSVPLGIEEICELVGHQVGRLLHDLWPKGMPDTLEIMGHRYAVSVEDMEEEGASGHHSFDDLRIRIAKKRSELQQWEILGHEIIHAWADMAGLGGAEVMPLPATQLCYLLGNQLGHLLWHSEA